MKKNKILWSWALAGALAVSNLSVVAAPFTSIVAQAEEVTSLTVSTAATDLTIEKEITFTVKKGETPVESPTLAVFLDDGTTPAGEKADVSSLKVTFHEAGKYKVKATAESLTGVVAISIENNYSARLDGAAVTDETKVTPGKSYTLGILENSKTDVTSTSNVKVVSDNAEYSGGILTIKSTAIKNDTVNIEYTPTGATKKTLSIKVGDKSSSTAEVANLSLSPKTVELTGTTGDDSKEYVLVGDDVVLPSGYAWKTSTYKAVIVNGDDAVSFGAFTENKVLLTGKAVNKKTDVTVRYTFTGVAEDKAESDKGPNITYSGQIEQLVTVYPAPKYKLTTTGDNYDKDESGGAYILNEEDGAITLTASVDPDGKDIPATDDVKYAWATASDSNIVIKADGASVEISPKSPFTASYSGDPYEEVTLTVTDKKGTAIPGIASSPNTYKVVLKTESKPTIEASTDEAKVDEEVKFTVKDPSGKEIKDFTGYTIKDGVTTISLTSNNTYAFSTTGSHKITVTDNNRKVTSDPITVVVRTEDGIVATGLKIDKDSVEMNNPTATVNVTVLPDGTDSKDPKKAEINTVTAKSSDEKVVTVEVTAPDENNVSVLTITKKAAGEATIEITADDKNVKDKKTVNVVVPGYKGIVLSPEEGEVEVGDSLEINADVQIYGTGASKDIVWHSSDESVATVKDGKVTGVAEGLAKIYATAKNDDSKISNEVTITVIDNTIPNAIAEANAAADAAVKNPTAENIQAAKDAVAAAEKVGATPEELKSATDKIAQAEAAKKAAEEEAKKKAAIAAALEKANAAADAALANPTDETIATALEAAYFAQEAGASDDELAPIDAKIAQAVEAKKAADEKKSEEEKKAQAKADAIAAAEKAADAAVATPTDDTIKAAKAAIEAAKAAGASDDELKSAAEKVTKAEAAKAAADEAAKTAPDGSKKDVPAPVSTELKDASGNAFKVTNATAGQAEVEFVAPANKDAKSCVVPDTVTDASGNVYIVTKIDPNAFKGTKTKTVTIGKNIKKISPKAFAGSNVKKVIVKGTKLTASSAKFVNKMKKGSTVKVKGANAKKNKKLLKKQSAVKKGLVKIK